MNRRSFLTRFAAALGAGVMYKVSPSIGDGLSGAGLVKAKPRKYIEPGMLVRKVSAEELVNRNGDSFAPDVFDRMRKATHDMLDCDPEAFGRRVEQQLAASMDVVYKEREDIVRTAMEATEQFMRSHIGRTNITRETLRSIEHTARKCIPHVSDITVTQDAVFGDRINVAVKLDLPLSHADCIIEADPRFMDVSMVRNPIDPVVRAIGSKEELV